VTRINLTSEVQQYNSLIEYHPDPVYTVDADGRFMQDCIIDVANRTLQSTRPPWRIGEFDFTLTTSMGVSIYPVDGEDTRTVAKRADEVLSRGKA